MWIKKQFFTLIELLIYFGALAVIGTLVLGLYYSGLQKAKAVRQAAADIARVTNFGDRWREKIRDSDQVELVDSRLILYQNGHPRFYYQFDNDTIWQRKEGEQLRKAVLTGVSDCRFDYRHKGDIKAKRNDDGHIIEPPDDLSIWKMEINLKSSNKKSRIKPLFCFIAANRSQKSVY